SMTRAALTLSDRHVLTVLGALMREPLSYGELKASVAGGSDSTLSARLKSMVHDGLIDRTDAGRSVNYRLTDAGVATCPIFAALAQWEQDVLDPRRLLIHDACGSTTQAILTCSECDKQLDRSTVTLVIGPGTGFDERPSARHRRRSTVNVSHPDALLNEITVSVVGNYWSMAILAGVFGGVQTFGDLANALGTPSAVLAERLQDLVHLGILEQFENDERGTRHGYRLSEIGAGLYPTMMMFLHWGDCWRSGESGPPMLHRHLDCDELFDPRLICSECRQPFTASTLTFARVVG
ncbi:MAG: helix-turn-helix domain-containing protein, partial [Ilumatobacteraceae bacterium]